MTAPEALFYLALALLGGNSRTSLWCSVIDWPWVAFSYISFGSLALYLQYRTHVAALDRLMTAHDKNVADLKMMIEVLQLALMHQESKAGRLNRVTHADFMEGAVSE